MKRGDLVKIQNVRNSSWIKLSICHDPRIIKLFENPVIQFLENDGSIVSYPIEHWGFEVVSEASSR